MPDDQFTNVHSIGGSGEFSNIRPISKSSAGTPITSSATIGPKKSEPFISFDASKMIPGLKPGIGGSPIGNPISINPSAIENYTQEGRKEHPVLSRVGDVTRGVKELLTGGQSAGIPLGSKSGILNNPITSTVALAAGGRGLAGALPNTERAGQAFQEVERVASKIPIDVSGPGNTALKIQKLSESGGSMPKVIRDFIRRATDPEKPPITYSEARDFYSNASRLSVDEMNRLTPVMKRQIGQFVRELNGSIEGAAEDAGKLSKYQGAMKEYRQAKWIEAKSYLAKKWAGRALLGAGGYYTAKEALGKK